MTNWITRTIGATDNFDGFKSVYDARIAREKKERETWGAYNTVTTDAEKKTILSEVKTIERAWLTYLITATANIKDTDEPKFETIEQAMFILSGVAKADRRTGQVYRGLWSAVDKYKVGRTYNGKTFGSMTFKSMSHYNSFLVGIAMSQEYSVPFLASEGITL